MNKPLSEKEHLVEREEGLPDYYAIPTRDVKEAVERLKEEVWNIDINLEGQGVIIDKTLGEIDNIFGRFE